LLFFNTIVAACSKNIYGIVAALYWGKLRCERTILARGLTFVPHMVLALRSR
jgi:hypothetical protein